jgi:hypothetical protein
MGLAKRDMKKALGASLKAEEQAVKNRFDKADSVFAGKDKRAKETRTTKAASKVVRDSFTMIEKDYELIPALKERCLKRGVSVNKSQILRAGLNALDNMADEKIIEIINNLAEVKTGRPIS